MSEAHNQDYYKFMHEENDRQAHEDTVKVNGFDPEDPKVWEQADLELKKAATSYDPFETHPFTKALAAILTVVGLLIIVGSVIALCMKFL